jgi:hypothetical protein
MAAHCAATAERRTRRAGSLTNCIGIQRCPRSKLELKGNAKWRIRIATDQVGGYGLPRLPEDPWEMAGLVQQSAIGFGEVTQARHGCVDDPVESVY